MVKINRKTFFKVVPYRIAAAVVAIKGTGVILTGCEKEDTKPDIPLHKTLSYENMTDLSKILEIKEKAG